MTAKMIILSREEWIRKRIVRRKGTTTATQQAIKGGREKGITAARQKGKKAKRQQIANGNNAAR